MEGDWCKLFAVTHASAFLPDFIAWRIPRDQASVQRTPRLTDREEHTHISRLDNWLGLSSEEHNVTESSPHYFGDQTLFCTCEKFLRRAKS
jgi:hypothetical protein